MSNQYTNVENAARILAFIQTGAATAPSTEPVLEDVLQELADSLGASAQFPSLNGVTPGTLKASASVVVDANKAIDVFKVLGQLQAGSLSVGATGAAIVGDTLITETITSATPAQERLLRSELTLNPATTLAIAANSSLAGIRGFLQLNSGKSITAGYLYGVQGKFTGDGATIAVGSDHVAGVYAQMSGNGMTVTNGHVAILICSGQSLPASSNIDAIYIESGAGPINSALKTILNANYVFDISEQNVTNTMAKATSVAVANVGARGWLKVFVQGAIRYIPLGDGVS